VFLLAKNLAEAGLAGKEKFWGKLKKVDANVLLDLKRGREMKLRIPKVIDSKEFREQAVKQITEEE
jgi:hypothetical protein